MFLFVLCGYLFLNIFYRRITRYKYRIFPPINNLVVGIKAELRIRIRSNPVFLGHPDPDPGKIPDPDPDPLSTKRPL